MKKLNLFLLFLMLSTFVGLSQNSTIDDPNRPNPEIKNGVATYWKSKDIGCPNIVPESWNKIIIKANVTLKGNFVIEGPDKDFVIEGEDWMTSILDNSGTEYQKGGEFRNYCNVRFPNHGSLLLKNFTSLNPANFHITAWAPLTLDRMRIIENRRRTSTDAAHSTKGVTILNSYISTYDDVLYVGECKYIYNTTIMHNNNGAPFMISWGGNADGAYIKAEKVTIIDNEISTIGYAHGVVGWAKEDETVGLQTVTMEFIDCVWKTADGKDKSQAFYSFGNNGSSVTNVKVIQKDGNCDWTKLIRLRNQSSGCEVVCSTSNNNNPTTPTNISDLTATALNCNSVKLAWSDISSEEAYRIRRKTATTDYIALADVPSNTTSYVDETAEENTTYQYIVRPMQGGVAVAVSNTAEIGTKACPVPVDTVLKVFPNPTTGVVTLPEVFSNDQITVISVATGATVLTKKITQSGSTTLDITSKPNGNYIIKVNRGSTALTRQIIKQ